jgi:enoyl-CoA hydratase/carnithine racemase
MSVVSLDVTDRIAVATLNRPEAMNGISEQLLDDLENVVARVEDDQTIKALIVTGAGESFCVGLDIGLLGRAFAEPDYFRQTLERLKRLLLDLEALPVPVIAAVNGLARAGGFEMILACDLVFVAEEARIADHHLSFGIMPGGGATQRAPRKLGAQKARELIFTAGWLRGVEAVTYGLALRAFPRERLMEEVLAFAQVFKDRSRPVLAATKTAMAAGAALPLEDALDLEIEHFIRYLTTEPTASEGYLAFIEKRDPVWP